MSAAATPPQCGAANNMEPRQRRTAITPFHGAQAGFRGALLRAAEAGWLCKASRGTGVGGMAVQ
jgi:hypothetical protein